MRSELNVKGANFCFATEQSIVLTVQILLNVAAPSTMRFTN